MFLVDSHCHLDMLDLAPYQGEMDKMIEHAKSLGIGHILNVSVSMKEFPQLLATAERYSFVSASVGLHPNEDEEEVSVDELVQYAQHEKIVALGETGLDYYRSTGDLTWQKERFRAHIQAAKAVDKPIIVHSRQAKADTIAMLKNEDAKQTGGVLHCFTEDWDMASQALDLDFYISFSGIVTFRNAQSVQEVAKRMPLERMLLETDAPYLAPVPQRGKPNEPAYIVHTAQYIAELRGIDVEVVAHATTENFFRLFKKAKNNYV
ncbi:MAG TPA: TatD family hydrolase [Gammaproteobacteria bacterium]|nr:TatD family hydrolase [Gammaproteobacteria bacterium]